MNSNQHAVFLQRATSLVRGAGSSSNNTNLSARQFISFFGIPIQTAFRVWYEVNRRSRDEIMQKDIILTLDFLFNYSTEARACLQFGLSEKTYRKIIWNCIHLISDLNIVSAHKFILKN